MTIDKYRLRIIIAILVVAIITILLVILLPLRRKTSTTQSTTTTSLSPSPEDQGDINEVISHGTPPPAEDTEGVDAITVVDTAINKLPLITDGYALFYDYDGFVFLANINAKAGTSAAQSAISDVEKWFVEQKVDIKNIKIQYLYKK